MRRLIEWIKKKYVSSGLWCWVKAGPLFLRSGKWVPHMQAEYMCKKEIIIATEKGFRIADSYEHKPGEIVYKDACYMKSRCIYCGAEDEKWYASWEQGMKAWNERWRG